MARLKAVPRSKAKTAWGLVMDAKRAIAEEPKRANMCLFVDKRKPERGGPACGTVGCFAGWITLLAGRPSSADGDGRAKRILGAPDYADGVIDYRTVVTRDGMHFYVFNAGEGDACEETTPGTPEHAKAVVARIEKFARINEKALRARKLVHRNGKIYGPDER